MQRWEYLLMHKVKLKKHDIVLSTSLMDSLSDTDIGIWLDENEIDYRIEKSTSSLDIETFGGDLILIFRIDVMSFFSLEDAAGFILRWSAN